MNILFLTPRESKTNLGGVERHVKLLTEELVRRGHEVKELSLEETDKSYKDYKNYKGREGEKDQKDKKEKGKSQKDRRVGKFRAWRYLWDRRELFRWVEVIHVHDVFWWYAPFAVLNRIGLVGSSFNLFNKVVERDTNDTNEHPNDTNRMTKTKVFVTFHGWEGRYPPTWVAVWQKRLAAFLSDGTIGVGSFFEKWYGVKTDRVVWGAIDPRIAKIAKISENRERGLYKGWILVFFGRLEEVNGIGIVIEAIKKIIANDANQIKRMNANKRIGFKFIFVGDGSYRKLAESVGKVTGMVREPWKYLADADVVIASSYLAILEAAALGKRIIAIENNPLKRDYLEGHPLNGYFKIVRSAKELIEEINRIKIKRREDKWINRQMDKQINGQIDDIGGIKSWIRGQTAEKLADEYEKLWRGGGDGQEGEGEEG